MSDNDTKPLQKPPAFRDAGLPPPPQFRKPDHPPPYFPQKPSRGGGGGRSCCCSLCLCFLISTLLLTLFFVSFGGFLYLLYEPKLPAVSLKSLRLDKLEISSALELNSRSDISIAFENPNEKIKFLYDKISVSLKGTGLKGGELDLGRGSIPAFVQAAKNVTVAKVALKGGQKVKMSEQDAKKVKEQFRAKSLMMSLEVISGIGVEIDGFRSGKVRVRVVCGGFSLKAVQNGAKPNCKVFVSEMNVY